MGKQKIEMIPITTLLSYQQILELSSREMHDFFSQVVTDQKAGIVSLSYKDALYKRLERLIQQNNIITNNIEKEVFKRVINTFGREVTTSKINHSLHLEYNQEKEKVAKEKAERAKKAEAIKKKNTPVKKLDTSVSSEKVKK